MIRVVLNEMPSSQHCIPFSRSKYKNKINRVNDCFHGTHTLWYTDCSVDF